MSERTIEFTIAPGEPVRIEAKGFEGRACREATQLFERALGGEIVSSVDKVGPDVAAGARPGVKAASRG